MFILTSDKVKNSEALPHHIAYQLYNENSGYNQEKKKLMAQKRKEEAIKEVQRKKEQEKRDAEEQQIVDSIANKFKQRLK